MEAFPFYRLGFSSNPFRVLTKDEWAEIAVLSPHVQDAIENHWHLQILGRQGRGKTTTLHGLYLHFSDANPIYHYVMRGHVLFVPVIWRKFSAANVLLLDEVQRLSAWEQWRLLSFCHQRKIRLIFTSHLDIRWVFVLRNIPLQTIKMRQHARAYVTDILYQRLRYFSLNAEPSITFSDEAITWLLHKFGDDLRNMQYHLYEVFQYLLTQDIQATSENPFRMRSDLLVIE